MTALDEFLSRVKERAEKATEGPWWGERWRHKNDWRINSKYLTALAELHGPDTSANTIVGDDADFIAHSRSDIPRLLKIVEELRGAMKELERPYLGYTPGEMPRLPDVVIREALRRADEIAKEGEK